MSEKLRCFVALNLPGELRESIGEFVDSLRPKVQGVKWVREENLHLTVKFLGDVEREALPAVEEALAAHLGRCRPFRVTLCGAGFFPSRGRPRVLWIDVGEGVEGLGFLQSKAEEALVPLGFPPEGRRFSPHLTVGRTRDMPDPGALGAALAAAADRGHGEFVADRVHLMQSELFPRGPRYSILQEVRLAPR